MRKAIVFNTLLIGLLAAGLMMATLGCGESGAKQVAEESTTQYICPMGDEHPTLYDEPGTCSECGMALVPVQPKSDDDPHEEPGHRH